MDFYPPKDSHDPPPPRQYSKITTILWFDRKQGCTPKCPSCGCDFHIRQCIWLLDNAVCPDCDRPFSPINHPHHQGPRIKTVKDTYTETASTIHPRVGKEWHRNYDILYSRSVDNALVLRVSFGPEQGTHVLVYSNVTLEDVIRWKSIDPSINVSTENRTPTEAPVPAALFPDSDVGFRAAMRCARYLLTKNP